MRRRGRRPRLKSPPPLPPMPIPLARAACPAPFGSPPPKEKADLRSGRRLEKATRLSAAKKRRQSFPPPPAATRPEDNYAEQGLSFERSNRLDAGRAGLCPTARR